MRIKKVNKKYKLKVVFSCFLLLMSAGVFAQDKSNVKALNKVSKLAKQMFVDMNNRDYDAILDMTHPKVFDIASREQMKTFFKGAFEGNEQFTIDIPKVIPEYKISKIFNNEKDSLEYAFVSYHLNTEMTFHNQEFDKEAQKMMISMMEAKGMKVEFISKNSMNVLMKDRITILLRDDSTENKWVMMNYDPDSPLSYQILPTSLLEIAKEYRQSLMLESKKKSEN